MCNKKQQKVLLCIRDKGIRITEGRAKTGKKKVLCTPPERTVLENLNKNVIIDNFIFCVVKRILMDFHDERKIIPA